jgi:hypothetical protein
MKTSAFLSGEAARYRRLATALVDDVRVSEAFSQMADELEARAAECDTRVVGQNADSRLADSVQKRSALVVIPLGVTDNGDAYRTAILFLKEFGPTDAPLIIAKGAQAAIDLGDVGGQSVWKTVLRAVQELIRVDRKPGEPMN